MAAKKKQSTSPSTAQRARRKALPRPISEYPPKNVSPLLPDERAELLTLYKTAIDEYRFQINLNWDRMRFYLTLNLAIITAGVGLLKLEAPTKGLLLPLFILGACTGLLGIFALRKSREYYRVSVFKKTIIEHMLGFSPILPGYSHELATLAVTSTEGMRETHNILYNTENWFARPVVRRGTVIYYILCLLLLCVVTNLAFCLYVLFFVD